jgi:hypothetical protein
MEIVYLFKCLVVTGINKLEHTYYVLAYSIPHCEMKLEEHIPSDWTIKQCNPIDDIHNNLIM